MNLGISSCIDKQRFLVFLQPALAIPDGQWVECRFLVLPHWPPLWNKELWVSFYALSVFSIRPKYNHSAKPLNWDEQTNTTYLVLKQGLSERGEMREGSADIKTTCREVEPWLNLLAPDRPLDILRLTQFRPCVPSTARRKHCSPALHPVINHRRRFICRLSGRAKQINKEMKKKIARQLTPWVLNAHCRFQLPPLLSQSCSCIWSRSTHKKMY